MPFATRGNRFRHQIGKMLRPLVDPPQAGPGRASGNLSSADAVAALRPKWLDSTTESPSDMHWVTAMRFGAIDAMIERRGDRDRCCIRDWPGNCRILCQHQATVVGAEINADRLAALSGKAIRTITADLTLNDDCWRVADFAASLEPVTGLFNCAGLEIHGTVIELSQADRDKTMGINAQATAPTEVADAATKGAVVSMTRAMALDHGRDRVRVVAVGPVRLTLRCCAPMPPISIRPTPPLRSPNGRAIPR